MYEDVIGTRCPACGAMPGEHCNNPDTVTGWHVERVGRALDLMKDAAENVLEFDYEESQHKGYSQGGLDGPPAPCLDSLLNPSVPVGMDPLGYRVGYLNGLILFFCDRRNELERWRPEPTGPTAVERRS